MTTQREMEKEIWNALSVIVDNFQDFDPSVYYGLKYGAEDEDEPPTTSKSHQDRFDRALDRVWEIIEFSHVGD